MKKQIIVAATLAAILGANAYTRQEAFNREMTRQEMRETARLNQRMKEQLAREFSFQVFCQRNGLNPMRLNKEQWADYFDTYVGSQQQDNDVDSILKTFK